jgi:hypothetical protein
MPGTSAPTSDLTPHPRGENKFHVALHATSLIAGTILGLAVALWVEHSSEVKHKRILIPVLIEGGDRQGGQFALGVSRAMEFAHRYRLDQIGDHRIDPWLLDERKPVDELLKLIDKEAPPIVVGPLRSTPSLDLVPRIARPRLDSQAAATSDTTSSSQPGTTGLGIPVILGIPTNTSITQKADLVWRLSPTDDVQGDFVATVYQLAARKGAPAVIVKDLRSKDKGGNPGYVLPLRHRIVEAVEKLKLVGYPALEDVDITDDLGTNAVQGYFETKHPETIIYLGMPDAALLVLGKARAAGIDATWIFTDSCITNPQDLIPRLKSLSGNFYITFQAPPALESQGLQLYTFYTRSTGGNVLFALDPEERQPRVKEGPSTDSKSNDETAKEAAPPVLNRPCDKYRAAPTYEVFGFDSYLTALLVLRDADGTREGVIRRFAQPKISDPLLIAETYEFTPSGDSKNTHFYLYEFAGDCTSYISLPELGKRTGRTPPTQ